MMKLFFRVGLQSLPIVAILLVIIKFVVSNQLAFLGRYVGKFDRAIEAVEADNEKLSQQVASASSLVTLASRAKQMGLVEPSSYLTIGPEQFPFALNQSR